MLTEQLDHRGRECVSGHPRGQELTGKHPRGYTLAIPQDWAPGGGMVVVGRQEMR